MKLKLSRKTFTLVLAVLIGTAMTPCVLHAQSQSATSPSTSSSTSTSTTKTSKRKAKKEAKKAAKAEKAGKANAAAPAAASSTNAAAANTSASAKTSASHHAASTAQAAPPQPGMVWVNTSSKVYHKSGSRWYGKTKSGKWMSEADAQKAGYKAAKD
ncbi:MAG TPA: hypothetical protein VGT04_05240 [Acidobacteriaceae bacterium]|nr:hypothetical protein [Acidobacteriaceae bacterium]